MMSRPIAIMVLLISFGIAVSAISAQKETKVASPKAPVAKKEVTHPDAGEQVFQANCSRCHYAPEQIPQQITGTVIRHMRVRANLSTKDEQLLLHFLNP